MRSWAIGLIAAVVVCGLRAKAALADPVPAVFPVTITASTLAASTPYRFTFALYDAAVGGMRIWSESRAYLLPASKRITHQLGSVKPATNPISPLLFGRQLWVEASAAGKTFPRVKLTVVPYAVRSELAGNIEGRVTAAQVDATGAAAGDVLTADGGGAASWQPVSGGGGGTVTEVATGAGLTGGPITEAGTISVATGGIAESMIAAGAVTDAKIAGPIATSKLDVGITMGTVAAGDHTHDSSYVSKQGDAMAGPLNVSSGSSTYNAGWFQNTNPDNWSSALLAQSNSSVGPAVEGFATGTGPAGSFGIANPASTAPALQAGTVGSGYAGHFTGNVFATGTVYAARFDGDGSSLNNVASNRARWQEITASSFQAEPDGHYIINSSEPVTVTLPPAAPFATTVRVSSRGVGGWKLAQSAGQRVVTRSISSSVGTRWTERYGVAGRDFWRDFASSADGTRLVAVGEGHPILVSTDAGVTWSERADVQHWWRVASSRDGMRLIAAADRLYVSQDGGTTWSPKADSRVWIDVASSADGTRLAAAAHNDYIYVSSDGGETWTQRGTLGGWRRITSSADGMTLAATTSSISEQIYLSLDGGVTWQPRGILADWQGVALSADGKRLFGATRNLPLQVSSDSGRYWVELETARRWNDVYCSEDGRRIIAFTPDEQFYMSQDFGLTWTPLRILAASGTLAGFAMSADGTRLLSAEYKGRIYTSEASTTEGPAGYLAGGQYSAVELQSVGNGEFMILNSAGDIEVH